MNEKQFLAEFGHIASAPEGVQRLREMIYNLAVTGDLTQQLIEDGDAQSLLEDIGQVRQDLVQAKNFKRTVKLENEPLSIPGNIMLPATWRWTRLLDIGEIGPRNEAEDEEPAAFIPMSGIPQQHGGGLLTESKRWGEIKKGFTHFANGDVVVAKITPCFENGKAAVISRLNNEKGIGAGTTELHVFRAIHPEVHPGYIYIFLRSPFFVVEGTANMSGTAGQQRLPTEYFATRAMPLPPFREQERIVAKVDELMALCDRLEALLQERQKLRAVTRNAVLDELAGSDSSDRLRDNWERARGILAELTDIPEAVDKLRQTCTHLAIRGLLVQQDPNDETAELLLDRIHAERERLVMKGKVKRPNPSKEISHKENPFGLPIGWRWARLIDLTQVITKGSSPKWQGISYTGNRNDVLFVTSENVGSYSLRLSSRKYVERKFNEIEPRSILKKGDFLMNIVGASIGRTAIFDLDIDANINQAVCLIRILPDFMDSSFLLHFFNSSVCMAYMFDTQVENARANLSMGNIANFLIPIPPIKEQQRIVLFLDKLTMFCEQLQKQLIASLNIGRLLSRATIESITGIHAEEEKELKVPKTQLVSKLRNGDSPSTKEQAPLATIMAHHNDELEARDLWQRYGGDIDAFYRQLKFEVEKGWIIEPEVAEMREVEAG
jgi:type I restriction enzyme, S subunit